MEHKATIIESIIENTESYTKNQLELIELRTIKKIARTASSVASGIGAIIFIMFFMTVLNIGLSIMIGDYLGKLYYGFFIIAGFYLLLTIIVIAFRRSLIGTPVGNLIIRRLSNTITP